MASLTTRVISAVIAFGVLLTASLLWGVTATVVLSVVVILISIYEFERLAFATIKIPLSIRLFFLLSCSALLSLWAFYPAYGSVSLGCVTCLLFSAILWIVRGQLSNEILLHILASSSLGILYCALLPSFAVQLLFLDHGVGWFFALLLIVFAGDTFAYFGGALFGKTKLLPSLSPKKTVEGAVFGLCGSILAGSLFFVYFLPHIRPQNYIPLIFVMAAVAQSGDLFASLIKRVAQVKDSGSIMPGHGGVLDRFDGVYFAAPVMYAFAFYFQNPVH